MQAEYSPDEPKFAYYPRPQFDEYFIPGIFAELDLAVIKYKERCHSIADMMKGFPDTMSIRLNIK